MIDTNFLDSEIVTIDLHDMQVWEAEDFLNSYMDQVPPTIREVIVIHGYHHGTRLMNYVRQDYKNKKVLKKFLWMNQGRTSLILKSAIKEGVR